LELLFLANSKQNQQKLSLLNRVDIKLKILKTLIRLCFDIKTIDQKKYLLLQEYLQEIGKMLGGWLKSIKKENPAF